MISDNINLDLCLQENLMFMQIWMKTLVLYFLFKVIWHWGTKQISFPHIWVCRNKSTTKHSTSKKSRYSKWCPATRYELHRVFSLLIAMGIDQRPIIHAYRAMDVLNYTSWYHQKFRRYRFEILYSTMLHINSFKKEQWKKDKIEPFLNLFSNKFQSTFYLERDVAIDETVVKWKGHSKWKMYNPA